MPIALEAGASCVVASPRDRRIERGTLRDRFKRLRIALVNNMPDAAVATTERQFTSLLGEASGDFDIRLILGALETLPRSAEARAAMAATYRDPRRLRGASLDAVIITGAEPRSPDLADEPYWAELTALMDFAGGAVISALYSCLAAHAAAFHRDRILRRRNPRKLSGLFVSDVVAEHALTSGLRRTITPHSRYYALAECDLEAKGYLILTRSRLVGPDVFIRDEDMLEVFWQGHPEYERDTLAREFRRDMLRYLDHEWPKPPRPPLDYFDADTLARVDELLALGQDQEIPLETIAAALDPRLVSPAVAAWRESATRLMGNWLSVISERKAAAAADTFARVRCGG